MRISTYGLRFDDVGREADAIFKDLKIGVSQTHNALAPSRVEAQIYTGFAYAWRVLPAAG
jgi:hypothetical protein